ncbi:MAG: hypothetical protein FWD23_04825 [Oscillospiraceae bacterium]|nr:hypothetical protein [Oscillospiraceae bacterium]
MLDKISKLHLAVQYAFIGFFLNLKNDERGLSGVVVAVLLILIAVLAVVLIWGFLSGWLTELWNRIFGEAAAIA